MHSLVLGMMLCPHCPCEECNDEAIHIVWAWEIVLLRSQ